MPTDEGLMGIVQVVDDRNDPRDPFSKATSTTVAESGSMIPYIPYRTLHQLSVRTNIVYGILYGTVEEEESNDVGSSYAVMIC